MSPIPVLNEDNLYLKIPKFTLPHNSDFVFRLPPEYSTKGGGVKAVCLTTLFNYSKTSYKKQIIAFALDAQELYIQIFKIP